MQKSNACITHFPVNVGGCGFELWAIVSLYVMAQLPLCAHQSYFADADADVTRLSITNAFSKVETATLLHCQKI